LPYLIGDKSLSDPLPDLSTVSGREDLSVRLAIAAHLLPLDSATDSKLHKITLILRERERLRTAQRSPEAPLDAEFDFQFAEVSPGTRNEERADEQSPLSTAAARTFGKSA
jgi:hypothetical protein